MNTKQTGMLILGGLAVVAIIYALKKAQDDVSPNTRVTKTDKGGLVSSPIAESRVAFLTNPLRVAMEIFAKNAGKVRSLILGNLASAHSGDKMARQGNALSALAANAAPLRSDYRASIDPALSNAKAVTISRAGNSFQFN